jgi:hypothetical protein
MFTHRGGAVAPTSLDHRLARGRDMDNPPSLSWY